MNPKTVHYRQHQDFASPSWLQRQSLKEEARWPNAYTAVLGMLFIWSIVFAVIAYIAFWR